MTDSVRVYVNAHPVDVPAGGTALDAVRALDPAIADQVILGTRAITDSRGRLTTAPRGLWIEPGLPRSPGSPYHGARPQGRRPLLESSTPSVGSSQANALSVLKARSRARRSP